MKKVSITPAKVRKGLKIAFTPTKILVNRFENAGRFGLTTFEVWEYVTPEGDRVHEFRRSYDIYFELVNPNPNVKGILQFKKA